ncbi:MAG: molybdopterin molybdotransferase MoeA [Peptococcaceae bacterium]|nr:molybdopterin molybdotransferase MoeA [Peptococcaceae bacterium]
METGVTLERAQHLLLEQIRPIDDCDRIALPAALGRVSGKTISAQMDQPPFHRSPLDGFALCHRDVAQAQPETPVVLRVIETIHAGDFPRLPLAPGEAVRVMTGAPLPEGADCVVRQEDTRYGRDDTVSIFSPQGEYVNFCFRGEDIEQGALLQEKGTRLDSAAIGVLASQGMESAMVCRRPKVCVISTGSELTDPGQPLPPGKIYDSNRLTLSARCEEIGAEVVPGSFVPDEPDVIAEAMIKALDVADLLITTGGVSVGEKDYMHMVGERIGGTKLFAGVKVKPGSPVYAMVRDGKIILCLSGNPFAAFATFELLAAPVIRKLEGVKDVLPRRVTGVMASAFAKTSPGRRFVRARMDGGDIFLPESGHASGTLFALIGCNCLIDIPAGNKGLQIGDKAEVLLF